MYYNAVVAVVVVIVVVVVVVVVVNTTTTVTTTNNDDKNGLQLKANQPACFDLVDCCDLDLDPLTVISELDLDMIVTYLHAKN